MPHIVIKTLEGKPREQLEKAAQQALAAVNEAFGMKPERLFSVSVEEYSLPEWEGVYNTEIKDNENIIIKPGYTNPVTFE